ncbi:MAG: hypothetical protein WBQ85_01640 [Candidatus Sulfotelmatobacter sp.]
MPGEMQYALEQLLSCVGKVSHKTLRFPKGDDVAASGLRPEIDRVYRSLSGALPSIPINLRHWDMEFEGIAVELDEYLHFNRYRGITLKSASLAGLPRFPLRAYRRYCLDHEDMCLKNGSYGGKWSNRSCETQFGKASAPGDLADNGSPRWKQRAFYDFVKDLSPLLIGVKVVRIAVWDELLHEERTKTVRDTLDALIRRPAPAASREASSTALAALIKERAAD